MSNLQSNTLMGNEVGSFKLVEQIGSGSFGNVYLAVNEKKEKFAIKLEDADIHKSRLLKESKIYKVLRGFPGGFPTAYWFGKTTDLRYNALVMDILGPSLNDLFEQCSRQFSVKTVLMVADQIVCSLEFLHSKGLLHRDIKPANFVMGAGSRSHKVYMIDFGLSARYLDLNYNHYPNYARQGVGTPLFASSRTSNGNTPSRRDDLESLCYMLLYLLKGTLPWANICSKKLSNTWQRVTEQKLEVTVEELWEGYPEEFSVIMDYCRRMEYEEEPNYFFIRTIFCILAKKSDYNYDFRYDWTDIASIVPEYPNDPWSNPMALL